MRAREGAGERACELRGSNHSEQMTRMDGLTIRQQDKDSYKGRVSKGKNARSWETQALLLMAAREGKG